MKISCPTCAAKYSVADEKIQSRLAKIRCRKCSSTIVIDGTASPASVYIGEGSSPISTSAPPQDMGGADAAPISARSAGLTGGSGFSDRSASEPVGPATDEYAVDIADNDQRNMTIHQIVGAYNEGLVTADTYIWKEGMADWQTLAEVREVAEALHAAARPMGAQPAAVRRPGPATDLFGSIDTAGGENDITTSAPQPMASAGTGARNESSVLFSLSALTGTPEAAPMGASAKRGRAAADDSGLIDLQALTSAEAAGGGAYAAPVGGFGASPLISAPLGGVSGPAIGASLAQGYGRRSNSRMSLVIAATVLAVGIIGAAAVVVKRGNSEEGEPTSALDKSPAAAPERAAAEPKDDEEAEPSQAGTQEPIAKDSKDSLVKDVAAEDLPTAADPEPSPKAPVVRTPVARAPRAPARAKPQPAAAAPAPEPAPVATPKPAAAAASDGADDDKKKKKKPASRCECKPEDLMCAMKCSAKPR